MPKPNSLFLSSVVAILSASAFAGSGNHGGDGVVITFLKGQRLAAEMIRAYEEVYKTDKLSNGELKDWFETNGREFALDVEQSPLRPVEESLRHDAMTIMERNAAILLPLPELRIARLSKIEAAEVLIHEAAHHFKKGEEFANIAAHIISDHWEHRERRSFGLPEVVSIPDLIDSSYVEDTAVMMGTELFLWANSASQSDSQGYMYDPAKNSWSSVSAKEKPSKRFNPSIVWTGHEVILWGGKEFEYLPSQNALINGAAYNPVSNRWRKISSEGGPKVTSSVGSVWTGNEMIIAKSPRGIFRYNPVLDKWSQTETDRGFDFGEVEAFWSGSTGNPATTNRLILVPGRDAELWNRIDFYSFENDAWESRYLRDVKSKDLEQGSCDLRKVSNAVWIEHRLLILVTCSGASSQSGVLMFNAKKDMWEYLPNAGLSPDISKSQWSGFNAVAMNKSVWLQGETRSVGYLFDLVSSRWRSFDLAHNLDIFMERSIVVWTGESILNLGGVKNEDPKRRKSFGAMIENVR